MQVAVPPLPPRPLTITDINTQPAKLYRTAALSARGATNGAASRAPLPDHVQMSARRFETDSARLERYLASDEHTVLTNKEPYSDPPRYEYRLRRKAAELAGPLVHSAHTERQRVEEAVTARDVGGRAFPYEECKLYPLMRAEHKEKWMAGEFRARLPSLDVFSTQGQHRKTLAGILFSSAAV